MCVTFWFDAYLIIKLFSFSSLYGEVFWVGRFHFNYVSPTVCNLRQVTFNYKPCLSSFDYRISILIVLPLESLGRFNELIP